MIKVFSVIPYRISTPFTSIKVLLLPYVQAVYIIVYLQGVEGLHFPVDKKSNEKGLTHIVNRAESHILDLVGPF